MGSKRRTDTRTLTDSHPDWSEGVRVALVHDWLTGMRGGEKVLEVLCELFPHAPLFTLVHNPGSVSSLITAMDIRTSFLDRLPFKEERYRNYLPLMPKAIESFDFSSYDLIISTSHAVAKGARPSHGALHICYCHTPMRYVWDQYQDYFGKGRAGLLTRTAMNRIVPSLRAWDVRTSNRVHHFIANSANVADRIRRIYGRESEVIHAPVDLDRFALSRRNDGYFLMVTALVPYKRVDLAIEAFNLLGAPLRIVGKGPDRRRLERMAAENVSFLGWKQDGDLSALYAGCRALIFPGEEDFGIVPLEAMACGKPVVAYAKGGALETVVASGKKKTGVFFQEQTVDSLLRAVVEVQKRSFSPTAIRMHASTFGRSEFKEKLCRSISLEFERHRLNRA